MSQQKERLLNAWYGDGTRVSYPIAGAPIPPSVREKLAALRAEFAARIYKKTGKRV